MANEWIKIGKEGEFEEGLRLVRVMDQRVVVLRANGKFFAFDALCPHAQGPMERAEVDGAVVSCPLHAWRFDLEGGGREIHGYRSLPVKEIKVDQGSVYIAAGD